jgi:hypothetical protein
VSTVQYSISPSPDLSKWVITINNGSPVELAESEEQAIRIATTLCNRHPLGMGRMQRLADGRVVIYAKKLIW